MMIVSFKHTRRGFCAEKQIAANLAKKMQLSAQRDPKNNFLTLFQVNYDIKISFFQDLKAFLKKAPSDLFRRGHLLLTSDLITPSRPNPHRRLGGHGLRLRSPSRCRPDPNRRYLGPRWLEAGNSQTLSPSPYRRVEYMSFSFSVID